MQFFPKKKPEEPQNIDEVLAQFKELKKQFRVLSDEMKELKKENLRDISKVAVVRFNPFEGLGGNQSFSLALLDANDCGAVVTSLFSRDGNRVYCKPIKNGASEFKLTEEEKKAIEIARMNK
jgi:hypothetical protein